MLFLKLFIIMGGNEVIAFLTWYYNQKDDKPWYIITMECVVYLTPVLLFILLCVNKRVGNQLRDKYPLLESRLMGLIYRKRELEIPMDSVVTEPLSVDKGLWSKLCSRFFRCEVGYSRKKYVIKTN